MQLKHRVALDGIELDSIDSRIIITKIEETDGKEQFSSVSLWGAAGSRVTELHRDYLDVIVRFCIRVRKRDMATREEILEKVNNWAWAGGWLTTNYKANRQIRVFRLQAAGMGDPWEWTKEFSLTFRACGVPYWQEQYGPVLEKRNASSGSLNFGIDGSADGIANVTFKNTSGGTINTFSISTPQGTMEFTGLGLANGETLEISHPDNGVRSLLSIKIGNRSALACRTPASANDLIVRPGVQTITYSAGGAGNIVVSCCGRFA